MHCTALRGVAPPPALSIDVAVLLAESCGVATVTLLPLAAVLPMCAMRCVVIFLCVVVGRGGSSATVAVKAVRHVRAWVDVVSFLMVCWCRGRNGRRAPAP